MEYTMHPRLVDLSVDTHLIKVKFHIFAAYKIRIPIYVPFN